MRLESYKDIPPCDEMKDVIVEILVEVITILSIATAEIKKGRRSESILANCLLSHIVLGRYLDRFLGKSDTEASLKRLDTLTQEEARLAIAKILKLTYVMDDKFHWLTDSAPNVSSLVNGILISFLSAIAQQLMGQAEEEKCSSYLSLSCLFSRPIIFVVRDLKRDLRIWLSPPDSSTIHNISRNLHHEGTATWFFQGENFNEWRTTPSLLWIHGKRSFLSSVSLFFMDSSFYSGLRKEHCLVCQFSFISYARLKFQLALA